MDIINGAIDSLVTSTGKEEWTPVKLSIADTTVAVMKDKARVVLHAALQDWWRLHVALLFWNGENWF